MSKYTLVLDDALDSAIAKECDAYNARPMAVQAALLAKDAQP